MLSFFTKSWLLAVTIPPFRGIINSFAGKDNTFEVKNFLDPVKLIEIEDYSGRILRFFGVHQDKQQNVNFAEFKRLVAILMGLKTRKSIQIIGDSTKFSEEGTMYARNFLRKQFEGNHLIEYGYTGQKFGEIELDINSFLNEYIDQYPDQAYRVLANIVGQTVIAIENWGCSVSPHVNTFVVVYNDSGMKDNNYTKFGNDIIMSDYFLNPNDKDKIICLEGGVQSFKQVTNSLKIGVPIDLVYNIRESEQEVFFSTAQFLKRVNDAFVGNVPPSQYKVFMIFMEYAKTLKSIWDDTKPDHDTKKALFDSALQDFIEGELYKSVKNYCTFWNAKRKILMQVNM